MRSTASCWPPNDCHTVLYFVSDSPIDIYPPRELLSFIAAGKAMELRALPPPELPVAVAALPPGRGAAFFVADDDTSSARLISALPRVRGPLHSRYAIPPGERFDLYFVPP